MSPLSWQTFLRMHYFSIIAESGFGGKRTYLLNIGKKVSTYTTIVTN